MAEADAGLTFVVVLALEGQCVPFGVFLTFLVCQVRVSVMVTQTWTVLVALPTN